uniref:Uncharacterized protein n=1 Tax=Phlebotomus papatasi TaxID=29031 RepID=A0A1B0D050_PHLPP
MDSQSSQSSSKSSTQPIDRFKLLYMNVNEDETPLPRSWSSQDKCNTIGLTQNNLRVHYKESMNYPWQSPLAVCVAHGYELRNLMAKSSLGACAFVDDVIRYH